MNIKELFKFLTDNYNTRVTQGKPATLVFAAGSWSIIFDLGKVYYKLTYENSYKNLLKNSPIVNKLDEMGVNVQPIYSVAEIEEVDNDNCRNLVYIQKIRDIVWHYYPLAPKDKEYVSGLIMQTMQNPNSVKVPNLFYMYNGYNGDRLSENNISGETSGIIIKKIEGDICFDRPRDECNMLSASATARSIVEKKLDYFNNIPIKQISKFIVDGLLIQKHGLEIDNISTLNVVYNAKQGFYYIDLDSIGHIL